MTAPKSSAKGGRPPGTRRTVGVNRFKTDLAAPFGEFRNSGIGRELGSEGPSAYLQCQSVLA